MSQLIPASRVIVIANRPPTCGSTSGKMLPAAKRMTSKMRTRRKRMALRAANVEPCVLCGRGGSGLSWGEMKRVMGVFVVMSYDSW